MHRIHEIRSHRWIGALMVGCLCLAPGVVADGECTAEVEVELSNQNEDTEVTHLQFSVDVSVTTDCAQIEYDLVIEELMPSGQTKRVRKPRIVKLNDGSLSEIVQHEMPSDFSLRSYEAKVVECRECDLMP